MPDAGLTMASVSGLRAFGLGFALCVNAYIYRLNPPLQVQQANPSLTTAQIAQFINGKLEGDPSIEINRLASIMDGHQGALTYLYDPKYTQHIYDTRCSAIIVAEDFVPEHGLTAALIRVRNPQVSFNKVLTTYFNHVAQPKGIDPSARISEKAQLGKDVYVGPFVCIQDGAVVGDGVQLHAGCYVGEGVRLGNNTVLNPSVTVYRGCVIGSHCILHAGTVVGADGFGFIQDGGEFIKIPQIGNVVIEDHVEIGANTCIDRGAIGPTLIKRGVKIDNLVHIAHNVEIGESSVIAGQVGIAGSAKLGRGCMLGGQVGISHHVQLADFTQISAQSGVSKNVKNKGKALRGSPAREMKQQLKLEALQNRIPDLLKRIETLEQDLERLRQNN